MNENIHLLLPKEKDTRPVWPVETEVLGVESAEMAEIPLLGHVAAGEPLDLFEYRDSVAVPASMLRKDSYALRVRGDSMIEDNIEDGDIIVVEKRTTAENGQSVVAMINGETVTLKRFYIEKDGIRLQPANPAMKPIRLKNEEIQILGVVMGVIRTP